MLNVAELQLFCFCLCRNFRNLCYCMQSEGSMFDIVWRGSYARGAQVASLEFRVPADVLAWKPYYSEIRFHIMILAFISGKP